MKQILNELSVLMAVLFVTSFGHVGFAQERPLQLAQSFGGQNDSDAIIRLNRAEEHIRNLTGQIEELNFQMRQLQDQIRRLQEDSEYRLGQLESATGTTTVVTNPNQNPPTNLEPIQPILPDQNNPVLPDSNPSGGVLGQLPPRQDLGIGNADGATLNNGKPPLDLVPFPNNDNTTPDRLNPDTNDPQLIFDNQTPTGQTGSPYDTYNAAIENLFDGNYQEAVRLFNQFVDENSEDPLVGVALFWLGESYFAQQLYNEATDAYLKSYSDYPDSEKASESFLKMGISLSGMGENELACQTLTEFLKKYPNAPNAVLNRAKAEYERVQCT